MKKTVDKHSVRFIAYTAAFVALSVASNALTINIGGNNAISLNYTVCFLSGVILGPFGGFLTGACGDVLGYFINPTGGAFNPFITLVSGLIGMLSGMTYFIGKKFDGKWADYVKTVISYVLIFLFVTNLNTVAIYFYFVSAKYSSFWAYYVVRTPKQLIFWAMNMAISLIVVKPIKKFIKI